MGDGRGKEKIENGGTSLPLNCLEYDVGWASAQFRVSLSRRRDFQAQAVSKKCHSAGPKQQGEMKMRCTTMEIAESEIQAPGHVAEKEHHTVQGTHLVGQFTLIACQRMGKFFPQPGEASLPLFGLLWALVRRRLRFSFPAGSCAERR